MIKQCLNENMHIYKLENGLDVIIIPVKNASRKYAMYSTHFGSINFKFKTKEDDEAITVPDGIAHFLEHKLFEQEDGENALDKLTKMGANPNAYTSFNHTSYLFECTENFNEVFKALMYFVQNPYLTKENVEKEKGIIGQEIQMYDDDPEWQLFFGFLNCLYGNHAITKDIAGTIETISHITPEVLYKCYNNFYKPSNMVICVVGNVDVDETLNLIKENVKQNDDKSKIERFYGEEQDEIYKKESIKNMDVNLPLVMFGFKDNFNKERLDSGYEKDNMDVVKYDVAIQIALELIAGKSSELYEELYNKGIVTREFGLSFSYEEDYAYSAFDVETSNYEEVLNKVSSKIEELKQNGINKEEYNRTKKMLYGNFVKGFNDVSRIASMVVSDYFKGINSFDYVEVYNKIDKAYVEEVIKKHFNKEKMAISIIKSK